MWNLKYDTKKIICETDSQIQRTNGYQWGEGGGRANTGVGGQETQTTEYKINKLQAHSRQQREIQALFCNTFKSSIVSKNIE